MTPLDCSSDAQKLRGCLGGASGLQVDAKQPLRRGLHGPHLLLEEPTTRLPVCRPIEQICGSGPPQGLEMNKALHHFNSTCRLWRCSHHGPKSLKIAWSTGSVVCLQIDKDYYVRHSSPGCRKRRVCIPRRQTRPVHVSSRRCEHADYMRRWRDWKRRKRRSLSGRIPDPAD